MSSKLSQLQRRVEYEAVMQDAFVADFERELGALVSRFLRRVRAGLREWDADEAGRLLSETANLGRALAFRRQLGQWLEQEGFTRFAERVLDEPLDRLAESVLRGSKIANKAAKLSPDGLDALAAFKELRLADLLDVGEDISRLIANRALEGVLGMRPVDALVQDIADVMDVTTRQARTLYDTAVSTFTRQVEQMQATGEGDELFAYVGPVDDKTRAFCAERVGEVFTRDEIDAMDNEQLPDTFLTGGGYNCRHAWKRVSILDDELRKVYEDRVAA